MRRTLLSVSSALIAVVLISLATTSAARASAWSISLRTASTGLATAQLAPAPGGSTATCNTLLGLGNTINLSWTAVTHAASYTVLQSTTSAIGTYTTVATVSGATAWTSGALAGGSYWFEVTARVGVNWTSAPSAPSSKRTITSVIVSLCT